MNLNRRSGFRSFFKKKLNSFERTIVRTENEFKVLGLIQKFWPRETGFDLIRVGSPNDGGYLIPNDFNGIQGLFSPGVAEDASFEKYFADLGIKCFLADASVESAPINHSEFVFIKKYLGIKTDELHTTLDHWVEENSTGSELILQMDIEGAEYEVLLSTTSETLQRFRIIIVEFHGIDRIITQDGYILLNTLLSKIEKHFVVAHCHPNNNCGFIEWKNINIPRVIEVTFHRKDRGKEFQYVTNLPHALDNPNVKWLPEIFLTKEWLSPI